MTFGRGGWLDAARRRDAMGRRSTRIAGSLVALFVAAVAAGVPLSVANGPSVDEHPAETAALVLAFSAFMGVGALIVAHRPGNAIGWIFSGIGLLAVTGALAQEYAYYVYTTRSGSLPGAVMATWYASWTWYPTLALALLFTPLLFPSGRPPSPRWRPVAWLAGGATLATVLLAALQPRLELHQARTVPNPIGVAALGGPEEGAVGAALLNLLSALVIAAIGSLVIRFRRSRGDERQQLKWFTYAGALQPLILLADFLPPGLSNLAFAVVIAFLPVAAGIAILRHRLYEIDRLINRTLVYGLVTALLAGVYIGLVFLFGNLLNPADGSSELAVAASTLAVAALFQPLRRRVQAMVDRRFNRARYDAARTVEAFSARLRDQVDLDTLSRELLAVVDQTVQPTAASLWLRSTPGGPARLAP
jgi:hypothetical protein